MTGLSGGTTHVGDAGEGRVDGSDVDERQDAPVANHEATDSERGLQVKVTSKGYVHYN